jgi:hypothetical protein
MEPKRKLRAALAVLLFSPLLLPPMGAQTASVKVVELSEVSGEGVSAQQLESLGQMIASYLVEMDGYRVIDAAGTELASSESIIAPPLDASPQLRRLPDSRIRASIKKSAKGYLFTLEKLDTASGEKQTAGGSFPSYNDIVLRARSLTLKAFGLDEGRAESPSAAQGGPEGIESLAGSWKGDKGLDRVRVFKDGSASAILSSGAAMRLRLRLEGGKVIVEQDQPNAASFFASPNYSEETAREIARRARPMRWIFKISADGAFLSGTKESVAVQRGTDGVLKIDNNYVREAVWVRAK